MSNFKKYTSISLLTLATLLICGYNYCYFSLHRAYQEKKYIYAETLALRYRYIIPEAYKIALKSAIEYSIEQNLAKDRRYSIIDPTLSTFHLRLNTYMTEKQIKSSQEPIIELYRRLKYYSQLTVPLRLSSSNIRTETYEDLANIATNAEFRLKDIYINSCYTIGLKKHLVYIQDKIENSLTPEGFSIIPIRLTLEIWCNYSTNKIKTCIEKLETMEKIEITGKYYTEVEKIFYDTILANNTKYKLLKSDKDKITLKNFNKQLFNYLERYSANRKNFPRTKNEQNRYDEIQKLIIE